MTATAYLVAHPEVARPRIRLGFTVDEETGHGTDGFELERFGAELAYTVDGSIVGEIQNETFSAVELRVSFGGVSAHAGRGKDELVNAVKLAATFVNSLPADGLSPETTDARDGFVHPYSISGNIERATVPVLVRDFDDAELEKHVALVRRIAAQTVAGVPHAEVSIERRDEYRNMREALDRQPIIVDAAIEAARRAGLKPNLTSIRGGTDGARLSELGLPTPNLFAGGNELHCTREWISVQDMAISAATILELVRLWAEPEWRIQ